jgi:hypothetical protein
VCRLTVIRLKIHGLSGFTVSSLLPAKAFGHRNLRAQLRQAIGRRVWRARFTAWPSRGRHRWAGQAHFCRGRTRLCIGVSPVCPPSARAGCLCMSGLLGRVSGRFRRAFAKLGQMSGKLRRVSEPPGREFEEPVRAAEEPGVATERFRRATTGSRFTAKEFSAAWRGGTGKTLMVARFIIGLRQGS